MTTPPVLTFNYAAFIAQFPNFANETAFPVATLQLTWDVATCFVSPVQYGWLLPPARLQVLNLYTAHLTQLALQMNNANGMPGDSQPGLIQNSTIGRVSVGLTPPPLPDQFQWYLNQTGYGQLILALLKVYAVGGWMVGGQPERSAIRQVYGIFPGQWPA